MPSTAAARGSSVVGGRRAHPDGDAELRLVIRQSNSSDERTGLVRLAANPVRWDSAASRRWPEELSRKSIVGAVAGSAFECVRQLEAVHARHVEVEHAEVERPAVLGRGAGELERLEAVGRLDGLHAPGQQLLAQDPAVGGVVVDDQRALARERPGSPPAVAARAPRPYGASDSSNQNVEPFTRGAVSPSRPPMSSTSWRQMARPRPVPPNRAGRRGVGLGEGAEQALLVLGAMPMPVSMTSKRSATRSEFSWST